MGRSKEKHRHSEIPLLSVLLCTAFICGVDFAEILWEFIRALQGWGIVVPELRVFISYTSVHRCPAHLYRAGEIDNLVMILLTRELRINHYFL